MDELTVNGVPVPVSSWESEALDLDSQQRAAGGTMRSAKRGDEVRRFRARATTDTITDAEAATVLGHLLAGEVTLGGLLVTDLLGAAILFLITGAPERTDQDGEDNVVLSFEGEQVGVA